MLLASPYPHDEISINRVGASIPLWPMYLPSRRGVLTDAGVDRGIGVHRRRVVRVVVTSDALPLWAKAHPTNLEHSAPACVLDCEKTSG